MNIGQRIKLFREQQNLTQQQLADNSETSRESIGNYENSRRIPTTDIAERIAGSLGVTVNDLVYDTYDAKTMKQVIKEKNYERKMLEITKITGFMTVLISRVFEINTFNRLHEIPKTEVEISKRKQSINKLYYFVEENYNALFLSKTLFNYCFECGNKCEICQSEKELISAQKCFSDEYRKVYKLIHSYMDFYLEKTETLYWHNGQWFWDISDKNEINSNIITASKEEEKYLEEINAQIQQLRQVFILYSDGFNNFEQDALYSEGIKRSERQCLQNRLELYRKYCFTKTE